MITYEFKCPICNIIVERNTSAIDETHCGKPMRRIYGLTSIHFKGPGFYTNDKKFLY